MRASTHLLITPVHREIRFHSIKNVDVSECCGMLQECWHANPEPETGFRNIDKIWILSALPALERSCRTCTTNSFHHRLPGGLEKLTQVRMAKPRSYWMPSFLCKQVSTLSAAPASQQPTHAQLNELREAADCAAAAEDAALRRCSF